MYDQIKGSEYLFQSSLNYYKSNVHIEGYQLVTDGLIIRYRYSLNAGMYKFCFIDYNGAVTYVLNCMETGISQFQGTIRTYLDTALSGPNGDEVLGNLLFNFLAVTQQINLSVMHLN